MKRNHTITKILALLMAAALLLPSLAGCSEPLEEGQIAVEWHMGRITSDSDENPDTLLEGEETSESEYRLNLPVSGFSSTSFNRETLTPCLRDAILISSLS